MARRSRRGDSFEAVKLIAVLIFLGVFALADGDLKRVVEFCVFLAIIGVLLSVAGVVLYFLFRKVGRVSFHPEIPRNLTHPAPARSIPDSDCASPPGSVPPAGFTQNLLHQLEWRRFEMLVQALFQAEGWMASRIRAGADGGIDLALRESPHGPVTVIVQCKAWKTCPVGVKPVRELFGVMHAEGAPRACFVTSGHFTSEAQAFADGKPIDLIHGHELLLRLNVLEESKRDPILAGITAGDYATPTCPSCDAKMVRRTSRYGEFWGCRSYPRCRQRFHIGK